jgi:NADH:ubiquinone oxidoreductase subunit F (NADH-binding)
VETAAGRVGFGPVAPDEVGRLFEAGFLAGGSHPNALGRVEDIPYLARQQRLIFTRCGLTDPLSIDDYRRHGGLRGLERALRLGPKATIEEIQASGLRGRGGAGFPTGVKWRTTAGIDADQKYVVCNADEGDSGTFADRMLMEGDPFLLIEGMAIASLSVGATKGYVYIRSEYPHAFAVFSRAIERARAAGLLGPSVLGSGRAFDLEPRLGAGAYICGEETAMLESLEGKRGYPRQKPPYPTQVGLFGRPTLIHNVETVYWVREILERGPLWLSVQGRNGRQGLRSFSVSGRVKEPGVKLAPAGITARELIDEYCGGMREGHTFKGYLPGGASGGILPAPMADIPLDFGTLEAHGCFIGSAAIVVLSDRDDVKAVALNLMRFFAAESCGQCTPCRCGTEKAVQLMERPDWDQPLLIELSATMRDASICGLGQAAPNPLLCAFRYFPEDFR